MKVVEAGRFSCFFFLERGSRELYRNFDRDSVIKFLSSENEKDYTYISRLSFFFFFFFFSMDKRSRYINVRQWSLAWAIFMQLLYLSTIYRCNYFNNLSIDISLSLSLSLSLSFSFSRSRFEVSSTCNKCRKWANVEVYFACHRER